MLSKATLLVHFDSMLPIKLHCDASAYGLGGVLSHVIGGVEKPVAYTSRTLNSAERNYSMIEKEGLAIVYAIRKFHSYLWGNRFTIVTDHKPLLGLLGREKPIPALAAARIQRWSLLLSAYNYDLEYRSGLENANADALSRLPIDADPQEESNIVNDIHMVELEHAPVTADEVKLHSTKDPLIRKVIEWVENGWPETQENSSPP